MRERLQQALRDALVAMLEERGDRDEPPTFALDVSRNPDHGDFACNAAMQLASRLKQPPRAIAERLVERLGDLSDWIDRAEVAGPGFVNIWLRDERWHDLLREILQQGSRYGCSDAGRGQRVQVEFVSANPTGPLTLGHGRQAVLGDVIARLLDASGYDVTREYYFNDGGRQMRVLGDSVKARYLERLGRAAPAPAAALADPKADWPETIDGLPVVFPRDGYQGGYIEEIAAELEAAHGASLVDEPGEGAFRAAAEERIFAEIRATLDALGIRFDVFSNEMALYEAGHVEEALVDLRAQGLVSEKDGATWFNASELGLERDRVLVRGTGEPTYLLPDIAYHREKFRRKFDTVIDVQGADHFAQFPYVVAAAAALGCPADHIELVMHQFVTLTQGGQQMKQSTRRATYVTVDELLEDVGPDVFRFFMVQRKAEGHLDFDLDLAREKEWRKNPAFYVQYGHARTYGIERTAREAGIAMPGAEDFDAAALSLPEEIEILKKLAEFPVVIEQAAEAREPHHLAYYARELAGLWNPYHQDRVRHRVVSDDPVLTSARLGLTLGVRTVLASALGILGISAPERM